MGYPGHRRPTDTGPQGSHRVETQPRPPTSLWDFSTLLPLHLPLVSIHDPGRAVARPTVPSLKNPPRKPPSAVFLLSPHVKRREAGGRGGQVPRACGAVQEAEISAGRSGKLTVSWPFASVLIYLAFYRRLCFIACRDSGRGRGSPSSRLRCNSRNNHDSRSSSPSQALIYLYRPRHLDIITFYLFSGNSFFAAWRVWFVCISS